MASKRPGVERARSNRDRTRMLLRVPEAKTLRLTGLEFLRHLADVVRHGANRLSGLDLIVCEAVQKRRKLQAHSTEEARCKDAELKATSIFNEHIVRRIDFITAHCQPYNTGLHLWSGHLCAEFF